MFYLFIDLLLVFHVVCILINSSHSSVLMQCYPYVHRILEADNLIVILPVRPSHACFVTKGKNILPIL